MTNSIIFNEPALKKGFFAGSVIIFLLGIVVYSGFHDLSGITLFFFGIPVLISSLVLLTRDLQKYPAWLSKLLEIVLILSLASVGFIYYFLQPEVPIAQPILWISFIVVVAAIFHAYEVFIRKGEGSRWEKNGGKMLVAGCLVVIIYLGIIASANAQTLNGKSPGLGGYNLSYRFDPGDQFLYRIQSTNSAQESEVPAWIKEDITGGSGDTILMNIVSNATSSGITTEKTETLAMTNKGTVTGSHSDTPLFPEMQRDLPNTITYPEKIEDTSSWIYTLEKSGNYTSKGNNVNYSAEGVSTSSYLGRKNVPVSAGNFDCIGIRNTINLSITEAIGTPNGTVITVTTINATGENWIDTEKGFLVKSSYNIDKDYNIDLTEVYHVLGFKGLTREIPSKIVQNIELIEKH